MVPPVSPWALRLYGCSGRYSSRLAALLFKYSSLMLLRFLIMERPTTSVPMHQIDAAMSMTNIQVLASDDPVPSPWIVDTCRAKNTIRSAT